MASNSVINSLTNKIYFINIEYLARLVDLKFHKKLNRKQVEYDVFIDNVYFCKQVGAGYTSTERFNNAKEQAVKSILKRVHNKVKKINS
jgi:hypothetical protein